MFCTGKTGGPGESAPQQGEKATKTGNVGLCWFLFYDILCG
jgi:hypothetical protein